jgi:hypothetical protein
MINGRFAIRFHFSMRRYPSDLIEVKMTLVTSIWARISVPFIEEKELETRS